jgi:hypothetical protein
MYNLQYTRSLPFRELRAMNSPIRQQKGPQDGALNPYYYLRLKRMDIQCKWLGEVQNTGVVKLNMY